MLKANYFGGCVLLVHICFFTVEPGECIAGNRASLVQCLFCWVEHVTNMSCTEIANSKIKKSGAVPPHPQCVGRLEISVLKPSDF